MNREEITTNSTATLVDYFNRMIPLNKEEKAVVLEYFKPRLYRKKQYVLQEGDICNQFSFIVQGCMRMYKVDPKGNLHIIQFASENGWLMDIASFHKKEPSQLSIDTIEDTMVLQISYDNLISLYKQFPKFSTIFRVLIENSFVALQQRMLQNISSTAEERYAHFITVYPHLTKRLPQTQIASFLGVSPEFLSRLRKRLMKS